MESDDDEDEEEADEEAGHWTEQVVKVFRELDTLKVEEG